LILIIKKLHAYLLLPSMYKFEVICISVIIWQSVLLIEKTVVSGENHWPVAKQWQNWSHTDTFVLSTPLWSWCQYGVNNHGDIEPNDGHWNSCSW
jgi:hypothetical protein